MVFPYLLVLLSSLPLPKVLTSVRVSSLRCHLPALHPFALGFGLRIPATPTDFCIPAFWSPMFGVSISLPLVQKLHLMFWFTCFVSFSDLRQNLLVLIAWNYGRYGCILDSIGYVDAADFRIQWEEQLAFMVIFAISQKRQAMTFRCLLLRTLWIRWQES